jgi:hypothetical protein
MVDGGGAQEVEEERNAILGTDWSFYDPVLSEPP